MQKNFQEEYDKILYSNKVPKNYRRNRRNEYVTSNKSYDRSFSSTINYQRADPFRQSHCRFNSSTNISRSKSPGFNYAYLNFANMQRDGSLQDLAQYKSNRNDRLPPRPEYIKKNSRDMQRSAINTKNMIHAPRKSPKYSGCADNISKIMPDSMSINLQSDKSPKSIPFTCISNQNIKTTINSKRNIPDKRFLRESKEQYISNRENKSKVHTFMVNLNEDSHSPIISVNNHENRNSSSTNYDEESDTMESIDEALPQKLAIHQTKMTRTLCEFKNSNKTMRKPVNIRSNIHPNIDAKERSRSPILHFDEEIEFHIKM